MSEQLKPCDECNGSGLVEKKPTIPAYSEHGDREQECCLVCDGTGSVASEQRYCLGDLVSSNFGTPMIAEVVGFPNRRDGLLLLRFGDGSQMELSSDDPHLSLHSRLRPTRIVELESQLAALTTRLAEVEAHNKKLEDVVERVSWVYVEIGAHFDRDGRLKGNGEWRVNKIVGKLKSLFEAYDKLVESEETQATTKGA